MKRLLLVIALGLFQLGMERSAACRFNVRDVGFVELGSSSYTLFCFTSHSVPEAKRNAIKSIGTASLLDVNVKLEMVAVEEVRGHSAETYYNLHSDQSLPWAALVGPDGRSLPISLEGTGDGSAYEQSLWTIFERLYLSPKREALQKMVMNSYGVVLVVEGKETAENQAASQAALKAVQAVAGKMESLPKAIKEPPSLFHLTQEECQEEKILAWSLGIDVVPPEKPHAAIVYGRGRLIGQILRGNQVELPRVQAVLETIGLSCECGLDRSWMQGQMIPLRWDETVLQELAGLIGFDPESPVIKMEMSQILSKGKNSRRNLSDGTGPAASSPGLDELFLGYSEEVIGVESGTGDAGGQPGTDPGEDPNVGLAGNELEPGPATGQGATGGETPSSRATPDMEDPVVTGTRLSWAWIILTGVGGLVLLGGSTIFLFKAKG